MSATVRKARRAYRCKRCGYSRVYEHAGAQQARHWFAKHSCRKQEEAAVREHLREARYLAVDRTPQPCLHKQANHQHGERATYVLDRCRCEPCSEAARIAENERRRLKAYGRYTKYVNAHPVRLHVRDLMDAGIGLKQIVRVSGVPQGVLWKLMYGKTRPDGTRTPSRRVLRATAEKLYAIEPGPQHLADGALVDATGTHRRIQALVAIGWSQAQIAARLGVPDSDFALTLHRNTVTKATAEKVAALYLDLADAPPVGVDQRTRIAISRSMRRADANGWPPPEAWDDTTIDDPTADPSPLTPEADDVDEVAVERALNHDINPTVLTRAERLEVIRQLHARGANDTDIGSCLGITASAVRKWRIRELGLPANPQSDGLWRLADRTRRTSA